MTIDINPKPAHSIADLVGEAANNVRVGRLITRFKLPSSLWPVSGGIAEVGFVLLTPDDELMAYQRIGTTAARLPFELARESLREIGELGPKGADGKPTVVRRAVSTADGTADRLWMLMHPKVRTLVVTGYMRICNPSEDETIAFLESREVSTP